MYIILNVGKKTNSKEISHQNVYDKKWLKKQSIKHQMAPFCRTNDQSEIMIDGTIC